MSTVFVHELTISVSDTGPKLVTKMFVLISVTFSVETDQKRVCEKGSYSLIHPDLFNISHMHVFLSSPDSCVTHSDMKRLMKLI